MMISERNLLLQGTTHSVVNWLSTTEGKASQLDPTKKTGRDRLELLAFFVCSKTEDVFLLVEVSNFPGGFWGLLGVAQNFRLPTRSTPQNNGCINTGDDQICGSKQVVPLEPSKLVMFLP